MNLLSASLILVQFAAAGWSDAPPLPVPLAGNPVAAIERADGSAVVYTVGAPSGAPAEAPARAFAWSVGSDAWEELPAPPGPYRRGATAQALAGRVYLIGGRTAGAGGRESASGAVDVYDPERRAWTRAAELPVAVSDAASGVWREERIFVVAGRGDGGAVPDVQVFDPRSGRWSAATPVAGAPVYGHAGAIARDAFVYVDGARAGPGGAPAMESASWRGDIDPADPTLVRWTRLAQHPGPALFGAAAGSAGTRVLFVGGADQAGEGRGAAPLALALAYDESAGVWTHLRVPPAATMDHRGLVRAGGYLVLVGGVGGDGRPTPAVRRVSMLSLLTGP